ELVRDVCAKLFADLGWRTLTARSGQEALEVLRHEQGPVTLLLTDIAMPGMRGLELGEQATALHPELTVIHMSGYTWQGAIDPSLQFLQKPFSRAELDQKVREGLNRMPLTWFLRGEHPPLSRRCLP